MHGFRYYTIMLNIFCRLYGAFKVAEAQISENITALASMTVTCAGSDCSCAGDAVITKEEGVQKFFLLRVDANKEGERGKDRC